MAVELAAKPVVLFLIPPAMGESKPSTRAPLTLSQSTLLDHSFPQDPTPLEPWKLVFEGGFNMNQSPSTGPCFLKAQYLHI